MQLDPVTFALEILNFLVLLWLLKRFLYAPVTKALAARQEKLARIAADAAEREARARRLEQEHEAVLRDWQAQRDEREAALRRELAAERERALGVVRRDAADERAKLDAQRAESEKALHAKLAEQAREEALAFASRLLSRVATPALEPAFADVLLEDLAQAGELLERLRSAARGPSTTIAITTAHTLPDDAATRVQSRLEALLQLPVACKFAVDPALIGGVRVQIGAEVLDANVETELAYFRNPSAHGLA